MVITYQYMCMCQHIVHLKIMSYVNYISIKIKFKAKQKVKIKNKPSVWHLECDLECDPWTIRKNNCIKIIIYRDGSSTVRFFFMCVVWRDENGVIIAAQEHCTQNASRAEMRQITNGLISYRSTS